MHWETDFLAYLKGLETEKPVIVCGDLNVAHENIDLKNWKTNRKNAGFSDEERAKFSEVVANGFIDTFRYFHPDAEGRYSWWRFLFQDRKNNAVWRISCFLLSEALKAALVAADINENIFGSDHCPVSLKLSL